MKKVIFISFMIAFSFGLAGCGGAKPAAVAPAGNNGAVAETGRIVDLTALNGKTATTTPGDVLYVKLSGDNDGRHQWNFAGPDAAEYVSLKDNKILGLNGDKLGGQFTSEWWLKVEKIGSFDISYQYALPQKKAEKVFQVKVISQ